MFTDKQKADAARREVKMRHRVYPRLVASHQMDQQQADHELKIMEEIADDYANKAAPELKL